MMLEIKATIAQGLIFVVGLAASIAVGMFLSRLLDSTPGLLVATIVAGAGLLGAAVLSQVVHDHIVTDEPDVIAPPEPLQPGKK